MNDSEKPEPAVGGGGPRVRPPFASDEIQARLDKRRAPYDVICIECQHVYRHPPSNEPVTFGLFACPQCGSGPYGQTVTIGGDDPSPDEDIATLLGELTDLRGERDIWQQRYETLNATYLSGRESVYSALGVAHYGADACSAALKAVKGLQERVKFTESFEALRGAGAALQQQVARLAQLVNQPGMLLPALNQEYFEAAWVRAEVAKLCESRSTDGDAQAMIKPASGTSIGSGRRVLADTPTSRTGAASASDRAERTGSLGCNDDRPRRPDGNDADGSNPSDSLSQDAEYWHAHYDAAMFNWNEAIARMQAAEANLARLRSRGQALVTQVGVLHRLLASVSIYGASDRVRDAMIKTQACADALAGSLTEKE